MTDTVTEVIDSYLNQLDDADDVDSRDLAENIVIQLRRRGV